MSPSTTVGGRVVRLVDTARVELVELPVPEPGPGQALVRLTACGVCGTDLHAYHGRPDTLPVTLGHDAVGVVAAVGPDTDSPAPVGHRVTLDPTLWCGSCVYCRHDRPQLCRRGGYLGMTCDGTMAEYLCLPAGNLVPLPDEVSDTDATVLEPIAVALHALRRVGGLAPIPARARVVGGGPLGLVLAQTLIAHGWRTVVHEPQAHRRSVGERLGLDVRDSADVPPADPDDGPLLVVETSASGGGVALAARLATPGSYLVVVGRAPADFATADILGRELTVLGSRGGVGTYPEAVELVRTGRVRPAAVVSHRFDLAHVDEAMRLAGTPGAAVTRALLTC
ncbi:MULTISPECIES: zinc-dependent alcohol dehydrogenase [Micromonospora]|uniref:L-gulonate 5-dehydrogenase n=1 Tax=Micromonospora yangpuensis TaxID=683228 RepID=A0A1C6UVN6_9ACTN|nr:alcohol dehydrogenase catalytic domain-containing protein [Micromonospora yangpuensis]GGM25843.1 iditol 2-dehydrogenase [Micromonospora yangpuensis]SCL58122.1 L-gulonate 5-dehydrogenase [Micromonospora yangpuensis]